MTDEKLPAQEKSLIRSVGVATFLVAFGLPLIALITSLAGLRDVETDPAAIDFVFLTILLVVIAGVFGLLVPWALQDGREGRQARIGLLLGVVAWISGVVFWTMAPVVFGAAAALIGYVGKRRGQSKGMTIAAIVLGSSAAVVTVAFYLTGF